MTKIKTKKWLGQHLLIDEEIADKIANYIKEASLNCSQTIEIGPGDGALTKFLTPIKDLILVEIDQDMIKNLNQKFPNLSNKIIHDDILKLRFDKEFKNNLAIVGNFPYNISSQIFFKILENKNQVSEVVCMLQKEVAQRITSPPQNKKYGILSVFLQAFYDIEYLFTVPPEAFYPPPKVFSGVIKLKRNKLIELPCNKKLFFKIVKISFGQRRKRLKNALKPFLTSMDKSITSENIINKKEDQLNSHFSQEKKDILFQKRAEELSVNDFIFITNFFK